MNKKFNIETKIDQERYFRKLEAPNKAVACEIAKKRMIEELTIDDVLIEDLEEVENEMYKIETKDKNGNQKPV